MPFLLAHCKHTQKIRLALTVFEAKLFVGFSCSFHNISTDVFLPGTYCSIVYSLFMVSFFVTLAQGGSNRFPDGSVGVTGLSV